MAQISRFAGVYGRLFAGGADARRSIAARARAIVGLGLGLVAVSFGALPASAQTSATTVTTLASSRNPADSGQTVAFTVRVQSSGLNPMGPIDLSDQGGTVASGFVPPAGVAGSVIAAGQDHSCAVTSSGGAMCWGYNGNGSLGTGNNTNSLVPAPVSGLSSGVSSIVATAGATCALTTAGGVKCWGGGYVGGNANSPADKNGLTSGIAAIAGRGTHACVLTTAGGVKCWGSNDYGQLGNGSTADNTSPVDVQGLTSGVVAITTGDYHSCAVTDAGAVKCWGSNNNGQLGNNSYTQSTTPVDVSGLSSGYKWVSAGYGHSCALSETGAVKCWGLNSAGQLGTGSTSPSTVTTPIAVSGVSSGVEALVSGANHSCVLEPTNKMMCWGSNANAQLGDGTTTTRSSPTAVPSFSLSTVSAIVAGNYHTCAELYDGTMKCWGYNASGQMGDNTITVMTPQSTAISTVSSLTAMTEGRAVLAVSTLSAGARSLVASFAEMPGLFLASRSATLTQTIVGAVNATTTTTLASSNASAVFGEGVTFTATVAASSGTATGSVDFYVDDDDPVSVALDEDGKATLQVSTLAVGSHTIGASYGGDTGFDRSKSSALTQDVAQAATTAYAGTKQSTVASGTPIVGGGGVSVTWPGSGTPTGTMTFFEGSNSLGTFTLAEEGSAGGTLTPLAVGTHTLHASYDGDTNFAASRSPTFTVTVTGANTASTTTIAASASKILPGGAVKFTATVTPVTGVPDGAEGDISVPTGSVVFKDGATVLGTVGLTGGKASLTTRALTTGAHSIVASYQGSSSILTSTSRGAGVVVDPRVGSEFRANTRVAGSQIGPSVAALEAGGFVTTWASQGQDGSGWGVYAQRYGKDGSRQGAEIRINSLTDNSQTGPAVVANPDGGFTAVWIGQATSRTASGSDLRAQRWSAAGTRIGSEYRVSEEIVPQISTPALTSAGDGGFVAAWTAKRERTNAYDTVVRIFDKAGRAKTGDITVGAGPSAVFTRSPAIGRIKGGYVVIWAHATKAAADPVIKGQRLSAAGAKLGTEFAITGASFAQSEPAVTMTADGGFLVAWVTDDQDGSGKGIYAQRFGANGARVGATFRVNTTVRSDQMEPVIATASDGGVTVVWTSFGQDGSKRGVFARRFDASMTPVDVEFRINTEVDDSQYQPALASRSATDFVVFWTSNGQDGSAEGIYGQRFSVIP